MIENNNNNNINNSTNENNNIPKLDFECKIKNLMFYLNKNFSYKHSREKYTL